MRRFTGNARAGTALFAGVALGAGLLLAACGGGSSSQTPAAPTARATTVAATATTAPAVTPAAGGGSQSGATTISAKDVKFSTDKLTANAGSNTFTFNNQDSGVPHNFAIYKDSGYTQKVGATDIANGPASADLKVDLQPGTYYFRCDVHPTQMQGTITVQ